MPVATSNNNTTFGAKEFLQGLTSLFGSQNREQSQQFSTKQVDDQAIAANTASTQAGLSSLSQQKDAAGYGAGLNQQAYQNKANTDFAQAAQLKSLNQSGGSSSSSFGKGAFQPGGYSINAYGQRGLYNASAIADWGLQQMSAIKSTRDYSEAEAAGDVARTKAQAESQRQLAAQQLAGQESLFNAQTIADATKMRQEQAYQKTQAEAERATRESVANTQAQAGMLSSLFGSVSSSSPNYRYWS